MTLDPVILPRSEHPISRTLIDAHTLKVLYRLRSNGHTAYLVGGCVRDLLLNRTPKDFDVVTDATPGQVKKLFRNCFLVGRRFRLAHVRFGEEVVEVATFRRLAEADDLPEDPADHHLFRENVFGSPADDAFRRDFTINALFYDIESFAIIDYVGGLRDLRARTIRVIGPPEVRYREDPVRMLRALEFAARLGFTLEPATRAAIAPCAPLMAAAAPARLREELLALFRYGVAGEVLRAAAGLQLLAPLLAGYTGDAVSFALLEAIDQRTRATGVSITEGFALAALYLAEFAQQSSSCHTIAETLPLTNTLLARHCEYFHVASGVRHQARELLIACFRFMRGPGQRGERRFLQHVAAREGFALFRLWVGATGEGQSVLERWEAQLDRQQPVEQNTGEAAAPHKRRRRRRGGKRRKAGSGSGAAD